MKQNTINALAALAEATAGYESAWRMSAATNSLVWDAEQRRHVRTPEAREADDSMNREYRAQQDAMVVLVADLGTEVANAVSGALIQAAARTSGVRPAIGSVSEAAPFILDCINGEAGI